MPTIYSRNKETGGFEKVGIGNIAIPKKTSDLINDSGFIDEYAVDLKISEIPIPDVSAQIEAHNTSEAAHDNIRSRMDQVEDLLDNITDDKVTNTLNVTAKAYITGTTSNETNTGMQVFDTGVYLGETPGELVATTFKGALDGNATSATSATKDASNNVIATTYETKSDASQKLIEAKNYTDGEIANLLNTSTEAVDSIFELRDAMENNSEAIDALTAVAGSKASQDDFDAHRNNTTIHTNSSEKSNWNAAYNHTSNTDVHVGATEKNNWNTAYNHAGNKSNPHSVSLTQLGVTATASELNVLDGITATVTELNYVDGVKSNIQAQLDAKQPTITGGATTIASSNLTASRALIANSSGKVAVSAVTDTELSYLDGVSSNVQAQLDAKIPLAGVSDYKITGNLLFADSGTTNGAFRGLQGKCGGNDYWRVGGSQTGSNAGYMEIATCDDGNEPIYVRQYSGVYSTLTRTATLLDGSGNTSFPGAVTVGGKATMTYDATNECLNFAFA